MADTVIEARRGVRDLEAGSKLKNGVYQSMYLLASGFVSYC